MLVVGVDIGGTGIKSALVKVENASDIRSYEVVDTFWVATQGDKGREVILSNVEKAIRKFYSAEIYGVYVSSAGTIDWNTGVVTYATDALMGFTGLEISKELTKRIGSRVIVINDAVAALIGEAYFSNLKGKVMMLTLGTGLGSSVLVNDKLDETSVIDVRLGHYTLHENGRKCFCGKNGCVECYVSANGLKKSVNNDDLTFVMENKAKYEKEIAEFILDFEKVINEAKRLYSPDVIVVGGGLVELKQYWLKDLTEKVDNVVPATLRNKAGFFGAIYAGLNGKFTNQ